MSTITKRLRAQGHGVAPAANFCEKCWDEAVLRSQDTPDKPVYKHYKEVLVEAESNVEKGD